MKRFHRFTIALTLTALTQLLPAGAGAGPVGGSIHFPPAVKMLPFTAAPKPLAVEATIPADGATNVGVQGHVSVRLNQSVPPDTDLQVSVKIGCRASSQAPWISVPLGAAAMADPKTFAFQEMAPLPFNFECKATLNGLSETISWAFKTRPKDECQLDACQTYYETMDKWLMNPEMAKCVDEGGEDCLVGYVLFIPKADYLGIAVPLLDECIKSHPEEDSSFEAEFIEATTCNNPTSFPDQRVWEDEEVALANLILRFSNRFQKADVQGKVTVWDPYGFYSSRRDNCQNTCIHRSGVGPSIQKY